MYSRSLVAARARPASRATTVGCAPLAFSLDDGCASSFGRLRWAVVSSDGRFPFRAQWFTATCHSVFSQSHTALAVPFEPVERAVFKGGHCPIATQNYRWLLDGSVAVHGVAWPTDSAPALTLTTVVSTASQDLLHHESPVHCRHSDCALAIH